MRRVRRVRAYTPTDERRIRHYIMRLTTVLVQMNEHADSLYKDDQNALLGIRDTAYVGISTCEKLISLITSDEESGVIDVQAQETDT